jgi:tetratricopeptide (TPR) repeat protein
VPEAIRARIDFQIGTLYLGWGDVERSQVLLASSVPVLRAQAEDPWTHALIAESLGWSSMYRGEHEEADRHFRKALELNKFAWADSPAIVYRYSELARNLSMQGRFDDAEAELASMPNIAPVRGQTVGDPKVYAAAAFLSRSRVKLDRGDPAAALALLPLDRADIEDSPYEHRKLLRGAALCALGRAREGLPLMETYTEKFAEESFAYHPHVAHWRAVTGLCALDAGNERRATELAELARRAFTQQPGVSPYYKAPLLTLEKRLGRR